MPRPRSFAVMAGIVIMICAAASPATSGAEESAPRRPEVPGSVYDKPFLRQTDHGVRFGGYAEFAFRADERMSGFDALRFVPFLYGQISDRVGVTSEIEFEHGGFVAGDEETEGEIKLEFATVDIRVSEAFNLRTGLILSPLGRFNINHDAPTNDLTERPLVDTQLIPSTLSEAGIGAFGQIYPGEMSVMTYEVYLVNGLNQNLLRFGAGGFDGVRLREGRGNARRDNNNARAFVGRLGFSPALGVGLGASVHTGRYTDLVNESEGVTILAFDGQYTLGPVEFMGELATATIGLPDANDDRTQLGFYGQAAWHFLPGKVSGLPNSIFTAVARYDQVDFDTDDEGDRVRRLTLGGNFRITEDTALKADMSRSWTLARGDSEEGDGVDAFRFSVATYF